MRVDSGDRKGSHASLLEVFVWILLSGAVGLETTQPLGTGFHTSEGAGLLGNSLRD